MSKLNSKAMAGASLLPLTISNSIGGTHEVVEHSNAKTVVGISQEPEPFYTLSALAERLGLPIFKIRRAAKQGLFPTYSLLNGRKLGRLSEVKAAIERSRSGGDHE